MANGPKFLGGGALEPDLASTYGTGCFMLYNIGPRIVRSGKMNFKKYLNFKNRALFSSKIKEKTILKKLGLYRFPDLYYSIVKWMLLLSSGKWQTLLSFELG